MMLWNLECPVRLSPPKKEYVRISVKEIWHNLDGLPKINSAATNCFVFSGPKVAQIGPGVELYP